MAEAPQKTGTPEMQESGITRVNDELSLGYDRDFERQWWRIEVGLWSFLTAEHAVEEVEDEYTLSKCTDNSTHSNNLVNVN